MSIQISFIYKKRNLTIVAKPSMLNLEVIIHLSDEKETVIQKVLCVGSANQQSVHKN